MEKGVYQWRPGQCAIRGTCMMAGKMSRRKVVALVDEKGVSLSGACRGVNMAKIRCAWPERGGTCSEEPSTMP